MASPNSTDAVSAGKLLHNRYKPFGWYRKAVGTAGSILVVLFYQGGIVGFARASGFSAKRVANAKIVQFGTFEMAIYHQGSEVEACATGLMSLRPSSGCVIASVSATADSVRENASLAW